MSIYQLFTPTPGEKVEFSLRRHPFTFLPAVALFFVLALLPIAIWQLLLGGELPQLSSPLLQAGMLVLMAAYYLGIWIFFFSQFTDYYLDINIVTNDRILDINQKGLFGRSIAELDLSRVQDVHSDVSGIIPTLIGYGLVEVQTAGEDKNFRFEQVPNPHRVRQRILELAALDRKREARELAQEGGNKPTEAAAVIKQQGL